jgi:hypothetical protein
MNYHDELDNSAASAEPEPDLIEWLTCVQELKLLGHQSKYPHYDVTGNIH